MRRSAASVRARLLNLAKAQNADFNQVLVRFALERMLYRLSQSSHADRFLLKGALLFTLWYDMPHRATRDADLLGFGASDLQSVTATFRDIANVRVDDGIVFDPSSVVAEEIRKEAGYGGARVLIAGVLDGARCRTQIDVGFGDAVTPADAALGQEVLARYQRDFFYAPRPDAQGYADGACWELGGCRIRAFHMPGHTAGHTVLLVEPEGVAFIGDIDLSGFGPYYGDAGSNLRDFRATLQRLPELPAKVWVTSHHRGVYTERDRFLRDLAAFAAKIDERSARLRALLAESPKTLAQLVACRLLYPPGHQSWWIDSAEARTIVQHLDELQAAGQVQVDAEGVWRLC